MKAWRGLLAATVFAVGVGAAFAQVPVLGGIEAPYAPLQSTVKIAGDTYGPGAVSYGPPISTTQKAASAPYPALPCQA
jgi:hypothetical protein